LGCEFWSRCSLENLARNPLLPAKKEQSPKPMLQIDSLPCRRFQRRTGKSLKAYSKHLLRKACLLCRVTQKPKAIFGFSQNPITFAHYPAEKRLVCFFDYAIF
jgi:hypothetical protein